MDFRVINFMQDNQKTLEWYVEQMEKLPYRWGMYFLPHDGAHGDFKTGQTAQQILEDMSRAVVVLERVAWSRASPGAWNFLLGLHRREVLRQAAGLPEPNRARSTRARRAWAAADDASHGADVWRYINMALPLMDNDMQARSQGSAEAAWRADPVPACHFRGHAACIDLRSFTASMGTTQLHLDQRRARAGPDPRLPLEITLVRGDGERGLSLR